VGLVGTSTDSVSKACHLTGRPPAFPPRLSMTPYIFASTILSLRRWQINYGMVEKAQVPPELRKERLLTTSLVIERKLVF
jgi:hypothetical protein